MMGSVTTVCEKYAKLTWRLVSRCVFLDAGVAPIDIETKSRAVAEHGELAQIAVDAPQTAAHENIIWRPPIIQVVRLASFQHPPSVPPFLTLPRQVKVDPDEGMSREFDESNVNEIAVGGGAVAVVVTRFPAKQKHPVGPLVVMRVRDGVLWLIDRLEFDLAMQSNDVKRALQCLLTVSYSRNIGHETVGLNLNDIMSLTAEKEDIVKSVDGVMKYAKVFLALIDAADTTAQSVIARETLKRLAAADTVKGALQGYDWPSWRSVVQEANQMLQKEKEPGPSTNTDAAAAFLASPQEPKLTSLADAGKKPRSEILPPGMPSINAPISVTRKAFLVISGSQQQPGKPLLLEGSTSTSSSAPPSQNQELLLQLNQGLHYQRKEKEHGPSIETDAAAAFLASLQQPKLTSLADADKNPRIEILPPGMPSINASISVTRKAPLVIPGSQQQPGKPLLLEGSTFTSSSAPPSKSGAPSTAESGTPLSAEAGAEPTTEEGLHQQQNRWIPVLPLPIPFGNQALALQLPQNLVHQLQIINS